jgi:large subunit ribosomal protein L17
MRHGNYGTNLGRTRSHRDALMRNLLTALFTHGRIRTTLPKAKALSPMADNMVTFAKQGDLQSRRLAARWIQNPPVLARLFSTIAAWYTTRQGGYTRVLKLEPRPGDNAPMAFVELVDRQPLGLIQVAIAQKKKFKKKGDKGKDSKAPKKEKEKKASGPAPAAKKAKPKTSAK